MIFLKDKKLARKKNIVALTYGILILTATMAALLAVKNIKISPDSMRFGLVSQQIVSGNGIRVPLIRLEDAYVPVKGAIPFLDQTPLFPILLALLGGISPQSYLPAQTLNVICHVGIAFFTFLLMMNLCNDRRISLLTGILVSVSSPLLRVTHHIWSETLFIALTVAAIYFLTLTRRTDRVHPGLNLFAAGICASAAFLTRNAGIALVPVFFMEAMRLIRNRRQQSKYGYSLFALTIPVFITVVIFVRNYIISGNIRGFNAPSTETSYLSAFIDTIIMTFHQFLLGKHSMILIIFLMTLLILFILLKTTLRREIIKHFHAGLDIIIMFVISYMALIWLTISTSQPRLELRYLSPLVPFLFIVSILSILFVWERIQLKGFSKLSLAGIILSLGIIAFGNVYKSYLNVPEFFYKQQKVYSILNSCTYHWIKENYDKKIMIVTNRPFHLGFFGGYSTVILPHRRFDPNIRIPEDMERVLPHQMSKFGAKVVALFEDAEERFDGNYVARLFNERADNDIFIMEHECPDGVVYNLRQ